MHKKILILILLLIALFIVNPINSNALSSSNCSISDCVYLLDPVTTADDFDLLDDYNHDQSCEGSDSILGDPNDENSVAWLLQQILNYVKVIGPILVVIMSSVDFVGVIAKGDDEAMTKAKKKLITRLILAVCLFFIPTFVEAILDIFGITSSATCGIS